MQLLPDDNRPALVEMRGRLSNLQVFYADRGVELIEVASGYRFQVNSEFAPFIQRLEERKPHGIHALF